jgi:hypothetical protein
VQVVKTLRLISSYFQKLFHANFHIIKAQPWVKGLETFVAEMLHNQTGLSLFGAADDFMQLDDVWMIEHFLDHVLALDLFGLDGKQDFDGHFSSVFFIVALEDV